MGEINSPADAERTLDTARQIMAPYAAEYRALPAAPALVGVGGTCVTSAAMIMGWEAHGEQVEGQTVTLDAARRQLALLASLPLEERRKVPGLPPARAPHMPHGLCILISAMESCGFDRLTVSGKTNLDGYLLSL
jgi:exopolyphosphatase/guanosine-5'-triphosphate,3'-diphosphate pyrophosphatase